MNPMKSSMFWIVSHRHSHREIERFELKSLASDLEP